jgi:Flp pilus assembly protein TadG
MAVFRGRERGASAVEFALIASLLFMVVFGIIQFGLAFNRVQGLHAGVREGARVGALGTTSVDDVVNRVNNSLSATISALQFGGSCGSTPFAVTPSTNNGCVWVSRRAAAGGAKSSMTSGADHPCADGGGSIAKSGDTIVVDASYRMIIQIPVIRAFGVTITNSGEFLCEGA